MLIKKGESKVKKLSFCVLAGLFFAGAFTIFLVGMSDPDDPTRYSRYELPTAGPCAAKGRAFTGNLPTKNNLSTCIVLLAKRSTPYGTDVMTQSVLNMISQKASPIITTHEILRDIKEKYERNSRENKETENKKLNLQKFYDSLKQNHNVEDVITRRKELLTTLNVFETRTLLPFAIFHPIKEKSFFEKNWTILKTENNSFYLLLPKPYLSSHSIPLNNTLKSLDKIGFNKNKWIEASFQEIDSKEKINANTITYENLTALFSKQTDKYWNIYMEGHGAYKKEIVGLKRDDFFKFLHFLETTLRTNLLLYSTCYGGGITFKEIEEKLSKIKSQQKVKGYPFTIMSAATTDESSLAFYEKWNKATLKQILKLNKDAGYPNLPWSLLPSEVNFYNFFKQLSIKRIEPKTEISFFKQLVLHIAPIGELISGDSPTDYLYDLFSIKFPGMPGFRLLEIDDKVQVLTIINTIRKEIEKSSIIASDKLAIAVYPNIINAPIIIEGKSLPSIISMSPDQDSHYFSKIDIGSWNVSSMEKNIVQIILNLAKVPTARKKTFYIEKLTNGEEILEDGNLYEKIFCNHLLISTWRDPKDHLDTVYTTATFFDTEGKFHKFDHSTNRIVPSKDPADLLNFLLNIIKGERLGLNFDKEFFNDLTSLKRFNWPLYLANNYQTRYVPIGLMQLKRHANLLFIAPGETDANVIENVKNWGIFFNKLSLDKNMTEGNERTFLSEAYLVILRGLQGTGRSIQNIKQLKTNVIERLLTVSIQRWHTLKLLPIAFDALGIEAKIEQLINVRLDTLDSLNKQIKSKSKQINKPIVATLQLLKDKKLKNLQLFSEQLEAKKVKCLDKAEKKLLQNLLYFVYSYINRYKASLILQELKANTNPSKKNRLF